MNITIKINGQPRQVSMEEYIRLEAVELERLMAMAAKDAVK